VPSSGSSRPDYAPFLKICGYQEGAAGIEDKSSGGSPPSGEDTGLDGDASLTQVRFLTAYFPVKVGTFSATDGTESFSDNSDGTLTGSAGGSGTIDYATGYVNLTFNAAPGDGDDITCGYQSGYTLKYNRSTFQDSLEEGYLIVTKLTTDGSVEEVRACTGARGNAQLELDNGRNMQLACSGDGVPVAKSTNDPAETPVYSSGAAMVWDENATVVLYTVKNNAANSKAYVGTVASIGLNPGFTVEEEEGAVTPGYTPSAQLSPGRSEITLDLYANLYSELDLEGARDEQEQFNLRCAVPGRVSSDNWLCGDWRVQITGLGDRRRGPGGREVVPVTFKVIVRGNAEDVTFSNSGFLYDLRVVTMP
jgi:hypothetical protein